MNDTTTAYLLWVAGCFDLCGLHRLYNGKIASGVLWLLTGGFCFVGQLIDLLLIPGMVNDHNAIVQARRGLSPAGVPLNQGRAIAQEPAKPLTPKDMRVMLVRAAAARNGRLSVTQAVMDTGLGFEEVEQVLKEMVKTGYVGIDNDPDTGVVIYRFGEL